MKNSGMKLLSGLLVLTLTAPTMLSQHTYATEVVEEVPFVAPTVATTENLSYFLGQILDKYGHTPEGAAEATKDMLTYKYMTSDGRVADAVYAINNRKGACYHYAALFYELMLYMGYDEMVQIIDIGRRGNEHSWVAVRYSDGYWYYFDPLYQNTKYTQQELINLKMSWDKSLTTTVSGAIADPANATPLRTLNMTINVNGESSTIKSTNFDNTNYIALREFASLMEGTSKSFYVGWNEDENLIELISNNAVDANITSQLSSNPLLQMSTIYKDGELLELQTYLKGDSTYFKLRDIADLFGINISWTEELGIVITTPEPQEKVEDILPEEEIKEVEEDLLEEEIKEVEEDLLEEIKEVEDILPEEEIKEVEEEEDLLEEETYGAKRLFCRSGCDTCVHRFLSMYVKVGPGAAV